MTGFAPRNGSADRSSSPSPRETAAEPCHVLAVLGGAAAAVLSGLFHFGWALSGHTVAAPACLVTAVGVAGTIHLGGRVRGAAQIIYAASFATAGLVAGQLLIADIGGVTGQGPLRVAGGSSALLWINRLGYFATPVLAAAFVPLAARLDRCPRTFTFGRLPKWSPIVAIASRRGLAGRPVRSQTASTDITHDHTQAARRPAAMRWLVVWLAFVAALQWHAVVGEHDGFSLLTFPSEPVHADNTLLGFASLQGGRPVMSETVPAMEQVAWFSGAVRSDNNFRYARAGYSFLGAQLAPLLGIRTALLSINWASWALCLVVLWRTVMCWIGDARAAAIAVALAGGALGFAIHLPATAPHLLAFALYYAGVWLVLEQHHGDAPRPWRDHCVLGLAIGMIGLVYNVHVMVLFVYLATGIGRQRAIHLAGSTSIALAIPSIWLGILPALGINIADVEGAYLHRALTAWSEALRSSPGIFALRLVQTAGEAFTSCASPWIIAVGGLGLLWGVPRSRDQRWAWATLAAPILACVLYAPASTARGYIVFGASIVLFAAAGNLFARGIARSGLGRFLTLALLGVALAGQAFWSTAHVHGWLGPAKAYFLGWDDGWSVLRHEPTEVLSLTGAEPVPAVFGGGARLVEAGAVWTSPTEPVPRRSRALALLARLPFLVVIAAFCCSLYPRRRARRTAVALVVLALIGAEVSYRTLDGQPTAEAPDRAIRIKPGQAVRYRIEVAEPTVRALLRHLKKETDRAGLHLRASGSVAIDWQVDGKPIPLQSVGDHLHRVPRSAAADLRGAMPGRSSRWMFVLNNRGETDAWVTGWQDLDQPRRELSGDAEAWALPAVELRVWGHDGFLKAAAF